MANPTFDINDPEFQRILAEAMAARMAAEKAAKPAKAKGKLDISKTDAAIVKAFEKAGYTDIVLLQRGKTLAEQPDVTVLTFQKWFEVGRRVKEQEHSIKVRGLPYRMFHKTQTRIATTAERKKNFAKVKAATEKREAKEQASA